MLMLQLLDTRETREHSVIGDVMRRSTSGKRHVFADVGHLFSLILLLL